MSACRPEPKQLRALARSDTALAKVLKRVPAFPGFPVPAEARRHTHFSYLAKAIVFQQLATGAATTIWGRVEALGRRRGPLHPEDVLATPTEALRGAGLSGNKLAALRDLAERVGDRRLVLAGIARLDDEAIIERLVQVRGIGTWSAQMFLIFRLGRLDVMPATDLGVREGVRVLDGLRERPPPARVLERAHAWAPLRSVAAWTLWRLLDEASRPRRTAVKASPRRNRSGRRQGVSRVDARTQSR